MPRPRAGQGRILDALLILIANVTGGGRLVQPASFDFKPGAAGAAGGDYRSEERADHSQRAGAAGGNVWLRDGDHGPGVEEAGRAHLRAFYETRKAGVETLRLFNCALATKAVRGRIDFNRQAAKPRRTPRDAEKR